MAIVSDVEIRLRADIARLQADMTGARRSVDNAMGGITRAAEQAKFALMGIITGAGLGGVGRMIDEYAKFTAQLKLASLSQREYNAAYADVKRISTQSTQGLQQTGVLYARIANGTRELGVAQKQVAAITETVNLALLVSGATATEAASAQLQLSQAFASGTLRGEEFNAVNEAAPRLMLALADGIGVPVGALKKMAEEGQITSKIMADVLPNALARLRDEAREVQTIAGAFTVLKNEVMEFVGVQAQANGVVAGVSGALTLLAQNLTLVAGAVAVITGARLVAWLSGVTGGALSAVAANRALALSNLEAAKAEATATAQAALLTNARLAEVRTATLAATGNVQLALTTNALIPAQARATMTTLAHDAAMAKLAITQRAAAVSTALLAAGTTALNRVLALTGGPIGLLLTVLGAAALAWSHYGNKAKEANDKAKEETEKSTQEIVDGLTKQNDKLRERLELQKLIGKDAVQNGGEGVARQAELLAKINGTLRDINLGFNTNPNAPLKVIEMQYEYTTLANAMEKVAGTQKELADGTRAKALDEWYGQNGTKAQKMAAELEALRAKFGEIPPEMEKLVRAKYTEKGTGSVEQATKAAREYIDSLKEQAHVLGFTAEQQRMHTAAQAAAEAPTAALAREIMEQAAATNTAIKANDAAIESQAALVKMNEVLEKIYKDAADARADAVKSARDEATANETLARTFGMTASQIAALELARMREQLAQRSSVGMTLDEIEHLEQLILLKEKSADAVASVEAMGQVKEFWTDVEKTAHDTFMSIADGNKGLWQRIRETAKNVFFNWLYQQTLKKWIINIQTTTTAGQGGLAALMGGEGGGGIGSWLEAGKSIYQGFTGGMAGTFGTWAKSAGKMFGSSAVSSFGSGLSAGVAGSGDAAMYASAQSSGNLASGASSGMALAKAIPIAGWIVAGMALSDKLYKQGWDAQNGSMSDSNSFGMKLANVFNAPMLQLNKVLQKLGMSNKLANMFSGASTVSRLFGRKNPEITAQGLQGTLGAGGFSGEAWADILEKGGVFRSDKRYEKTAGIDAKQDAFFDKTMAGMMASVKDFGAVLGAQANAVDGYSKQIKLTLTDDEEKNQKLIEEVFGGVADDLATLMLPTIMQFAKDGETAGAALQRVAGNFAAVTALMDALNVSSARAFGAVGVASIEARERLVDLAGGIDALASQTSFFAQNFLTQAEQLIPVQRYVTEQMAALGYSSVQTADQFKAAVLDLANSGALATEAGARTYAGLLALAPQFKAVLDAAMEAGRAQADAALEETARMVNAQKNLVTTAYSKAMAELGASIESVNGTIERTGDLSRALKDALGTVETPDQQAGARLAARAQITTALALAKAGGILPSADDLQDALAALNRDASGQFGTLADYQREVARTNNELLQLGGITDEQLSTAERQLKAMQEQQVAAKFAHDTELVRLDGILSRAQAQVDGLAHVNTTLQDIHAAIFMIRNGAQGATPGGTSAGTSLAYELQRQNASQGGLPMPNFAPASGTINGSSAPAPVFDSMDQRLARMEETSATMARAMEQLAQQFNSVSAGGNALLTEPA